MTYGEIQKGHESKYATDKSNKSKKQVTLDYEKHRPSYIEVLSVNVVRKPFYEMNSVIYVCKSDKKGGARMSEDLMGGGAGGRGHILKFNF